jgi:hypothetical protein
MAMVSVKINELSGLALDYAVAVCEGHSGWESTDDDEYPFDGHFTERKGVYFYGSLKSLGFSYDWSIAGHIIERELLVIEPLLVCAGPVHPLGHWRWKAYVLGPDNVDDAHEMQGVTPLIAAMRCYVASKTEGDSVMIPEELV